MVGGGQGKLRAQQGKTLEPTRHRTGLFAVTWSPWQPIGAQSCSCGQWAGCAALPKAISEPGWGKAKRRTAESGCSERWSLEMRGWSRVVAVPGQRHPRSPSGSPPSSSRTSCGTARSGAGDTRVARSTSANQTREGNLRQSRRKQEVAAWLWGTRQISDPAPQRPRLNPRQVSGIDLEAGALRWSRLLPRWWSQALNAGLWGP